MSLIFMESFDHFATDDIAKKWHSFSALHIDDADPRRAGTKYLVKANAGAGTILYNIGSHGPTIIVGAACKQNNTGSLTYETIQFLYGDDENITIRLHANGVIQLLCGSVDVSSASAITPSNTWFYLQLKVYMHGSAGTYELKIGEDVIFSGVDVNTLLYTALVNRFCMGFNSSVMNLQSKRDDLYICDGSGSKNNDFLGDCRVDPLYADAPGDLTQFTPSAGANWENVDDPGDIDDDDTYNQSQTVGHNDLYNLGSISALGKEIFGIQQNSCVRKTDAGYARIQQNLKSGATSVLGSDIYLTDNYKVHQRILELNPDDDADWEEADLNALQAGIKVILAG